MEKIPQISPAEWQVMKTLWEKPPATTNDVVECLTGITAWKPKTIMTLLRRLTKKGALNYQQVGRAYEYFPIVDKAECRQAERTRFCQRIFGGSHYALLTSYLEDAVLSPDEVKKLKALLEQKNQGK